MDPILSYVNPFQMVHVEPDLAKNQKDIKIEVGSDNRVVDTIRNILSIPDKLLLWNSKMNSGNVSPSVIEEMRNYLDSEGLHDVSVSVNQYKPQESWQRAFSNPKTSLLAKMTGGITSSLLETFSFNKLTGFIGDHYNPFSNTVHLFSDDIAIALHECGHAKDFNSRRNPSLYVALGAIPTVGPIAVIMREYLATHNAIQYMQNRCTKENVQHAYKMLTPALATYVADALFPDLKTAVFGDMDKRAVVTASVAMLGIIACGHVIGRVIANQYQKQETKDKNLSIV